MALHETEREPNRICLQTFNTGVLLGMSTTIIGPLTTVAGYKAAVLALAVHESEKYALVRINKAADVETTLAVYDDTVIAAADTVAGMRALSVAVDASITDAAQQGSVFFGE